MTLNLQAENKGGLLSGGELTVFLDGPGIEAGPVAAGEGERGGAAQDGWPFLSLSTFAGVRLFPGEPTGALCPEGRGAASGQRLLLCGT